MENQPDLMNTVYVVFNLITEPVIPLTLKFYADEKPF
jgi:hypothetical protein